MEEDDHPLIGLLKDDLQIQAKEIWRRAKQYHGKQKGDNIQDTLHCLEVEKNIYKLIIENKNKKKLKQIDLFILSLTACLHDIGKMINENSVKNHGERSEEIIVKHYKELGLDKGQAHAVASIAGVHHNKRLNELSEKPITIGSEEINIIDLSALFCLGDMLDTYYGRVSNIFLNSAYETKEIPGKSLGRQAIMGWYLDDKNRIIMQAAPDKNQIEAVTTLYNKLKEELFEIFYYLQIYNYPFELGTLDIRDSFYKQEFIKEATQLKPFPGLGNYTRHTASIFKGRKDEINKFLPLVYKYPIILLIGKSGVGKTSLIQAGFFPYLENSNWKCIYTKFFTNGINDIKITIWNEFFEEKFDKNMTLVQLIKKVVKQSNYENYLLVIDQFEDFLKFKNEGIFDNFSILLSAALTGTVIPKVKILLSFREDSLVELNLKILKRVARNFPSIELNELTRDGAKSALLAGFENAELGIDSHQKKGEKLLIEQILDDLQKDNDYIFPPDLQMVAEILCDNINETNPIITKEKYVNLGGSGKIIAQYLLNKLSELGSQKNKAEVILISLISSKGKRIQRNIQELKEMTQIEIDELKIIIDEMINLRIIDCIDNKNYEIINDYLAENIDVKLVKEEDRIIKSLEESLNFFLDNYIAYKTPIYSNPFMAKLFSYRKKIEMKNEQYSLILNSVLMKKTGLGWYWLKEIKPENLFEKIKDQLTHDNKEILEEAMNVLFIMAKKINKGIIYEMLNEKNEKLRKFAIKSFEKIATIKDKNIIIKLLKDEDEEIQEIATKIFSKIATFKDINMLIETIKNGNWIVSQIASQSLIEIILNENKESLIEQCLDLPIELNKENIEGIIKMSTCEDKEIILKKLFDENRFVKEIAAKLFQKIITINDKDTIIKMLNDGEWDIQRIAAKAFLKICKSEDKEILIEMLQHNDPEIQETAAEGIIRISTDEEIENLLDHLSNNAQGYSEIQCRLFSALKMLDKKLYCPYYSFSP